LLGTTEVVSRTPKRLTASPQVTDDSRLVILFDKGGVSASDIALSLAGKCRIIFALRDNAYTERMIPFLREIGQIVHLAGDAEADAEQLALHRPDGILTFSEAALVPTACLAEILGLPFHDRNTIQLLTNKEKQRAALSVSGVDRVATAPIHSKEDWQTALSKVGLPAVVKPVRGSGSTDVYLVRNEAESDHIRSALFGRESSWPYLLAEEYLEGRASFPYGDYVSVESVCGPQGIAHVAVTGKFPLRPPFTEQGSFWPSQLPVQETTEVTDLVSRALAALKVSIGITHTEIQLTAEGPRILEVNGRLGGQIHDLSVRSDSIDLITTNALLALGKPVSVQPVSVDTVTFLHVLLAPVRSCTLTAVHGIRSVRRIPGITGYTSLAYPGEYLPGGMGPHRIGLLYGKALDHESMVALVAEARATLRFEFSYNNEIESVRI
jgi:hypothetical protein